MKLPHGLRSRIYNFWVKYCPLPNLFNLEKKCCTHKEQESCCSPTEKETTSEASDNKDNTTVKDDVIATDESKTIPEKTKDTPNPEKSIENEEVIPDSSIEEPKAEAEEEPKAETEEEVKSESEETKEKTKITKTYTKTELKKWTKTKLQELLSSQGVEFSKKEIKSDLIKKILK